VWNYEGASLAFYLVPYFRQTFWFKLLMGLAGGVFIASVAYSLARARHQRRLARARQREILERERGRIARDMHDEVGAQLTRIAILSRLAEGRTDAEGKLRDLLGNITRTSRESVKRFDEIVWAVNPRNDPLGTFADYLTSYAASYFDHTNVRCILSIPASLPDVPLSSASRHNLIRACEEAMGNALRHAEASEVKIAMTAEKDELVICISDNGKGFSGDPDGPQANGLRNMEKRLSDIGGTCRVKSTPGEGTSVRMQITLGGAQNRS
jgi:signal transduction histidine kinase